MRLINASEGQVCWQVMMSGELQEQLSPAALCRVKAEVTGERTMG